MVGKTFPLLVRTVSAAEHRATKVLVTCLVGFFFFLWKVLCQKNLFLCGNFFLRSETETPKLKHKTLLLISKQLRFIGSINLPLVLLLPWRCHLGWFRGKEEISAVRFQSRRNTERYIFSIGASSYALHRMHFSRYLNGMGLSIFSGKLSIETNSFRQLDR